MHVPEVVGGDQSSPVAVCTLSSHDLLDQLSGSPLAGRIAMLGSLETENLGIERMLTTLLRAPRIRWLIVCGDEARGRYQGQALHALFEYGIRPDGAIIEARSRRARLRALSGAQVDVARRQVHLRDLQGVRDLDRIAAAVEECWADDPGPFAEPVELPESEPIVVPGLPFRLKEHDPAGFFVILVDRPAGRLLVEHYTSEGSLGHRIAGPDAESLCGALIEWGLLTRLDHAAYMGRELARAESALRQGLPYRQDEHLGEA
jgi:tetrahydromethanopterin S-methyltransferase subunit A